ncbi:hypothetical protein, variant [Puccinia triticina 1-1 BBBD Race 1]|uniref:Myb_DNA-bind_3 domain-containing protein n=1 Tax=Puccinia triticina (isolate 1-1 / race 1 (BBBD)) TaxID=630390 RepID=A0A180GKJ9_PUCT1|nr:hypothetical protein, variant [Puccinia triticina 1-1 BBBD Race 1]
MTVSGGSGDRFQNPAAAESILASGQLPSVLFRHTSPHLSPLAMSHTDPLLFPVDPRLFGSTSTSPKPTGQAAHPPETQPFAPPSSIKPSQKKRPSETLKTPQSQSKKTSASTMSFKERKKAASESDHDESAPEESENEETPSKKRYHHWTNDQKISLLTFIINQIQLGWGKPTNNGNIKDEGWIQVTKEMNKRFGVVFTLDQLKNQKGSLRKLYIDQKFLLAHSAFGWDDIARMVTADDQTWTAFIKAHPKRKFVRLRTNPIPWSDLAEQLFGRTISATGYTPSRPEEVPPQAAQFERVSTDQSPASINCRNSKKFYKMQDTPTSDNARLETVPQTITCTASPNRSVSPNTGVSVKDEGPSAKVSVRGEALKLLSSMFLDHISTEEYVRFVKVLQSESNAELFISLASTSNASVCKAWLAASG